MFIVYKIRNKLTKKYYIGYSSKSVYDRFKVHFCTAENNKNRGKQLNYFMNSLLYYGYENWELSVICCARSKEDALSLEILLIAEHQSNNPLHGYNSTSGGEGASNSKRSDETKKKQSEYAKNRKPGHNEAIGRATSAAHERGSYWHLTDPEYTRKISERQLGELNHRWGKKMPEDQKQKLSKSMSGENNPFYGKTHSKETIEKMLRNRERSFAGKLNPAALRIAVDGLEFDTKREAMKHFDISYTLLQKWITLGRAIVLGKNDLGAQGCSGGVCELSF
jgi:group I intron endonuclease